MLVTDNIQKIRILSKRDGYLSVIGRIVRKFAGALIEKPIKLKKALMRRKRDEICIAFYPAGGLGDYIISAKVLEELLELTKCKIIVYAEKMEFAKAVYGNRERVTIREFKKFELEKSDYDLALVVEHFIHIKNIDWHRLSSLAPELFARMKYLKEHWNQLYINIPQQCYRELVHFQNCRVKGLNRWTELRMGQAFEIKNQIVHIPMLDEYKREYYYLPFSKISYVTINCGTDAMRKTGVQTKAWLIQYYEELALLIKSGNPNISIVQLGASDGVQIQNADYHIMGESLELTKWILKGSHLHIDIEGGLVHLAVQMGTKCAVLFGPTPMFMYAYKQNINIRSEVCYGCMGCQEDWAYQCSCGNKSPLCMESITPEAVYARINNHLKRQE